MTLFTPLPEPRFTNDRAWVKRYQSVVAVVRLFLASLLKRRFHLRRAARISGACDGRMAVILNMEATPALTIVALGFAVIALGVVYWLLREREDRSVPETKANPTD
jgi:uncharacterized membrane protein (DUF373 family)